MRATTLLLTAALTLTSTAVFAQSSYNVVVQPVSPSVDAIINAPVTYDERGVVEAQHFNADNLTDAQYQELLDEADRIRAYRAANNISFEDSYTESAVATTPQSAPTYEYIAETSPVQQIELFAPESTVTTSTFSNSSLKSHTVSKGDTLYNISKRYDTSVDAIKTENGLSGTALSIGQKIRIPGVIIESINTIAQPVFASAPIRDGFVTRRIVEPAPQEFEPRVEPALSASETIYAVLPKDTLYSISRRTCVGVKDIVSRNGISNPNALKPGQRLTLPEGHCLTR
ncbi:hypothetical protein GCM10011309_04280 [Litorimonas cladophorae]|uniref:LysM domain-containing protein n=1 Tax=Litorimonas cladophorae TaxID=1220491 RepID=A0A918KE97_9PROT|nr:LysM peptidoglycan-binding domain-containing protein [Litorimonas cladophorae]GGX58208.1 hypothetical protein GCM10011309_04280 [Litorimonas cladophorae]